MKDGSQKPCNDGVQNNDSRLVAQWKNGVIFCQEYLNIKVKNKKIPVTDIQ